MSHNVGDEKQVKKQEEIAEDKRNQELEDIKYLLNNKVGMRFFKRFFDEGHVFRTTFILTGCSAHTN